MASQDAPISKESWLFAGLASSFPNITPFNSTSQLSDVLAASSGDSVPVCQILQLSNDASDQNTGTTLLTPALAAGSVGLVPQILIFQYRGKFHAVDHQCPHRSFPLSRGSLHDIEDFGIILSAGLTCPKHGWAFDVFTGESDRGSYQLKVWDIELRNGDSDDGKADMREVWVRKKTQE